MRFPTSVGLKKIEKLVLKPSVFPADKSFLTNNSTSTQNLWVRLGVYLTAVGCVRFPTSVGLKKIKKLVLKPTNIITQGRATDEQPRLENTKQVLGKHSCNIMFC